MGVDEFGDADVVFSDNATNAGQRQLQFVGRGRDRNRKRLVDEQL